MDSNSPEITKVPFFKSLRDGIFTINKGVLEIEEDMKTPSKGSADKALTKLVNISAELKARKISATEIAKDLEISNRSNYQYFIHMESLIENMEGRLKNVTNHLTEFGYVPPSNEEETKISPEIDLNQNNSNIDKITNGTENNAEVNVDGPKVDINDYMKTPICINTNPHSNFNKILVKGERLFAPSVRGYNASSPGPADSNLGFGDFSTISGDNASAHIENLSFNLKLDKPGNDGCSPQLPVMTSSKEMKKLTANQGVTPEDPLSSRNRERVKINTPEDPTTSYNITQGSRDTPEDPPVLHTNVNSKDTADTPDDPLPISFNTTKHDTPQTPKTPELTSKFRRF